MQGFPRCKEESGLSYSALKFEKVCVPEKDALLSTTSIAKNN